jgi:hypothetical protein
MRNLGFIILFVLGGLLYGCTGGVGISANSGPYSRYYDTYYYPSYYGPVYPQHYGIHHQYHHGSYYPNDHWVNGRLHHHHGF